MAEQGQDSFAKAFIPGLVLGLVIGAVLGAVVPPFLQTSPGPVRANKTPLTPEEQAQLRGDREPTPEELERMQAEADKALEDAGAATDQADSTADDTAEETTPPDEPPPAP